FLAPDPVDVLRSQMTKPPFTAERVDAIDEVLESLGWPLLGESDGRREAGDERRASARPAGEPLLRPFRSAPRTPSPKDGWVEFRPRPTKKRPKRFPKPRRTD